MSSPKPVDWRQKYDYLLSVLFRLRNDPKAKYQDLRLNCEAAEDLHRILETNKRYEWRSTGEASYLWPLHDKNAQAVAVIVKDKPGVYTYSIIGRGFKNSTNTERTEKLAKQAVESYFELLKKETD